MKFLSVLVVPSFAILACLCFINLGCTPGDDGPLIPELQQHHFGAVRTADLAEGIVEYTFEVSNPSLHPLRFEAPQLSCACVKIACPPVLESGETGHFTLSYEARGIAEQRDEFARFQTGNPDAPFLTFRLGCFSVPNAVCEPTNELSVTYSNDSPLEVHGVFTTYVTQEQSKSLVPVSVDASGELDVALEVSAVVPLMGGVYAVRTPYTIGTQENWSPESGTQNDYVIRFRSFDDCEASVRLHLKNPSDYQVRPGRIFLTGQGSNAVELKLSGRPAIQVSELLVGPSVIPPTDWQVESTDDEGVVLSINRQVLRETRDAYLAALPTDAGAYPHLEIRCAGGKATVPVLAF